MYEMQGLSFREFIELETGQTFQKYSLEQILEDHRDIADAIQQQIKPYQYFHPYLRYGYYPFYKEEFDLYEQRLEEVINMMLEIELPLLRGVDIGLVPKIKQLITIIAESVPYVPNIAAISQKMNIHRTTLMTYLYYLEEVGLTIHLQKESFGNARLQKPSKIYLENTNLMYILSPTLTNMGNVRETFFANQVGYQNQLTYHAKTDFMINQTYAFEVGGREKPKKQISGIDNAFIASDETDYGYQNKIPLWLFGFLY